MRIHDHTPQPARGRDRPVPVRRALLSVSDATGVVELAQALAQAGAQILATAGTARMLRQAGVPAMPLEALTGFTELLDGRVKTLHPAVFAGILARDVPAHHQQLASLGAPPIDLVAVTLYPFESRAPGPPEEAADLIDVGGVALLRAAAKNWERVAALSDPSQYGPVIEEVRRDGGLSAGTRRRLAAAAFARTAAYDATIAGSLAASDGLPVPFVLACPWARPLRYGENPHQRAAFYRPAAAPEGSLASAVQLQGKDLSYTNLLDLDAGWRLVGEFDGPAAAIIKHATPCGVATASTLAAAYAAARAADPVSAFGGVVAFNREVDGATAQAVVEIFTEGVVAPGFTDAARAAFSRRPALRVLAVPGRRRENAWDIRSVGGGVLVQEPDTLDLDEQALRVVTPRAPTPEEMADLRFAWIVAKWVKSNAVVLARGGATVGIGAGQTSRVGAVEIAVKAAGERAKGAAMASDAFFPFRDGIDVAARAGVTAVIQPGGSVRDAEVIAAATEHGMAMVFTGIRHFRH
ncbi:MAG: bifunctional phosphoribosylaminoimidazolecarboxamide formyltransferase/IMP cyclohydrolase [Armatimonadota bacterium]|nr:bifunctional phosphoribosylaminoimidazolecarboxamide formyltransferase/IMP cyclohydrolase [Armatimonadota bacterium]